MYEITHNGQDISSEPIPLEVAEILYKYECLDNTYDNCAALNQELKPLGWQIEYGLDACISELIKL